MTELYFALRILAAEPEPQYFGMTAPVLLGVGGLLITLAGTLVAAFSKKWRTPADDREDKKIGIEADEKLLKRFQDVIAESDAKVGRLEARIERVEEELEELRSERSRLIDWIYAAIKVVRDLGGIDQLPPPPRGVTIADHPSARHEANTGGTS
ncbi:hypothetical protein [Paenarthrobacter nitroguajacolicus]|mgnify:FL=1|uniref:hypothetical protein n=1 Tax=Paenarthrobacter nitroguajacolicus TaxID=211146 RepID=UPI0015B7A344|nr:hypothetical protein [Paenarthrobacter nitroguajacolicus]NWL34423.1 hypothetical protein [Paenarthrobacter nitroguajacolicus]